MYRLNEVFAQEESARAEVWAGAYPFAGIRLVFGVQRHGNWCFCTPLPITLECLPPGREISISFNVSINIARIVMRIITEYVFFVELLSSNRE